MLTPFTLLNDWWERLEGRWSMTNEVQIWHIICRSSFLAVKSTLLGKLMLKHLLSASTFISIKLNIS
jgi:hypothetical protein